MALLALTSVALAAAAVAAHLSERPSATTLWWVEAGWVRAFEHGTVWLVLGAETRAWMGLFGRRPGEDLGTPP